MKHLGNITVTRETVHDFPAVGEFFGHLTIGTGVELIAPELQALRGWLTLQPGARLTTMRLGRIEGWVSLGADSMFFTPNLTEITEDLVVDMGKDFQGLALVSVGSLIVQRDASLHISVKTVRRGVTVSAGGDLLAPQLIQVGQSITLREGAHFEAPALTHIGGFYDADPTAVLIAPAFTGGA